MWRISYGFCFCRICYISSSAGSLSAASISIRNRIQIGCIDAMPCCVSIVQTITRATQLGKLSDAAHHSSAEIAMPIFLQPDSRNSSSRPCSTLSLSLPSSLLFLLLFTSAMMVGIDNYPISWSSENADDCFIGIPALMPMLPAFDGASRSTVAADIR